jgi:predicted nucleotidyltransferase
MLLRDKDIHSLIDIFSAYDLPFEVWAHGSRVSGEAHEGSDLDLVVRYQNLEPFPLDEYLQIKDQIQKSNIPILVDIFDWARLPESFHANIKANHEVLYSNKKAKVK